MTYDRQRLREILEVQGRRKDWLAKQTEYSIEHVSRVLSGSMPMTEKFAVKAAIALGIPLHWLQEDRVAA